MCIDVIDDDFRVPPLRMPRRLTAFCGQAPQSQFATGGPDRFHLRKSQEVKLDGRVFKALVWNVWIQVQRLDGRRPTPPVWLKVESPKTRTRGTMVSPRGEQIIFRPAWKITEAVLACLSRDFT